jgi:hypothetical protein
VRLGDFERNLRSVCGRLSPMGVFAGPSAGLQFTRYVQPKPGPQDAGRSAWPHRDTVTHSFRATSGPVIRFRSGNVEAMIASEATSPAATVAQYVIPGMLNAMPTCEWR